MDAFLLHERGDVGLTPVGPFQLCMTLGALGYKYTEQGPLELHCCIEQDIHI